MLSVKALRKYREEVAAKEREASEIIGGAAAREGDQRGLTDDETKKLTALQAGLKRLRPLLAQAEELVEGAREAAEASEERRRGKKMTAEEAAPPKCEDGPRGKFLNFGDFVQAQAVTALAQAGKQVAGLPMKADERILEIEAANGAATSDNPLDGNNLVMLQYSNVLLTRAWEQGQVRQRCVVQDVGDGFDGVHLPYLEEKDRAKGKRYGGVEVFWAEDDKAPDITHVTGIKTKEIRVKSLRGLCKIPEKLLRDASALGSYVLRAFPAELTYRMEDAIINGDGKGKPLGVVVSPAFLKVAKEGAQPGKTIVAENIIKAYARFLPLDMTRSAVLFNRELLDQLPFLHIKVGQGGQLIYMPPGGITGKPYGSIYGFPAIPIEQCKGAGTPGDFLFFDGGQYVLVMKPGIRMAESLHFYFDTNHLAIRWEMELNGQPELDGTIKPENAADANFRLSGFVGIDTRA